jgi:hypothetical protein
LKTRLKKIQGYTKAEDCLKFEVVKKGCQCVFSDSATGIGGSIMTRHATVAQL